MTSQIEIVSAFAKALYKLGHKDVPVHVFNAIIKAATDVHEAMSRPVVGATDNMGLDKWLKSDDTGASSTFMANVLFGTDIDQHNDGAYPRDPDDFGRCYRFIRAVPVPRERIAEMASHGKVWAAYVNHWAEMEQLYETELPSGKARKLYDLMQRLQKEAKP